MWTVIGMWIDPAARKRPARMEGPGGTGILLCVAVLLLVAGCASIQDVSIRNAGDTQSARVQLPDGSVYQGPLRDGLLQGTGTLTWPNGDRYEGEFRQGLFHGRGIYTSAAGDRYVGEFREGRMTGEGVYLFANGNQYVGQFRDGLFHGFGMLTFRNGDQYIGEFVRNRFHGRGRYVSAARGGRPRSVVEGRWVHGRRVDAAAEAREAAAPPLVAEVLFFRQPLLLARKLKALAPQRPERPDLYFVGFAADGGQDVFMKEVQYISKLFENRFAARGRTLSLVNNRARLADTPIASVVNLEQTLHALARRMDPEQDILFLYLTSHGTRDHRLVVSLEDIPLRDLSAQELARLLDEAGLRWKVVVISACYSGGFIEALKDETTMVITSAHPQRSSFGCSDDSEMTYFGRAFFREALPEAADFRQAFQRARELVTRWEQEAGFEPSRPQFYSTPAIEAQLRAWRATLPALH